MRTSAVRRSLLLAASHARGAQGWCSSRITEIERTWNVKLIGKQALALAGGGVFALAVAISATQAATAAGIGTPSRTDARIAADMAMSVDHRGIAGKWLGVAATYIGITEAALRTELGAGKSLAEVAVANGKTRDGLVAALTAAAAERIGELVDRKGLVGPGGSGGPGKPGRALIMKAEPFAVASTYLGISREDLMARVRAGETLAAIANATAGKSRDGLIAAIVADNTAKIDAAVTAGTITADQATRMKAELTAHATRTVDQTRELRGPKPRRP